MAAVNNITRSINPGSVFEEALAVTSLTESYDQGDLLIFDETLKVIKRAAVEADCETFLGVAIETVVLGKLKSPYTGTAVDAAQAVSSLPGPKFGVIVRITLKTGDTLAAGGPVYWSADQEVSATGTKQIGVYQGKDIATAPAGTKVEVLLGHRFPGDALAGI